MSLVSLLYPNGKSGFGYASTAEQVTDGLSLEGRTYLVTGSNSGIGNETIRVLMARGAHVLAAARTVDRAIQGATPVAPPAGSPGGFTPVACELSEPESVRACVETVRGSGRTLDGIVCNAGIMALDKLELKNGYELQFYTNHMGHFVLVTGLLDRLTPKGRVVMLSSAAHQMTPKGGIDFDNLGGEKGYQKWTAYGRSKLANLLFARELARRLPPGQTANAVHPGVIQTNLGRHMNAFMRASFGAISPLFLKSIAQGAATQVWAATHPSLEGVTGAYLLNCNVGKSSALGRDDALARRLWEVSERIAAGLPAIA